MTVDYNADDNSTTNEELDLDNETNEEETTDDQEVDDTEEDEVDADDDSETNDDEEEEEKPLSKKKRKSGVPKLLAEKNKQAKTIKSLMQEVKSLNEELKEARESGDAEAISDAKLEKKFAEMNLANKLAEDYPDVDADDARAYAKEEGVSILNAFKLLNLEVSDKMRKSNTRKISGNHYDSSIQVYSMKDLNKMNQEDYNKALAKIEKGKAEFRN